MTSHLWHITFKLNKQHSGRFIYQKFTQSKHYINQQTNKQWISISLCMCVYLQTDVDIYFQFSVKVPRPQYTILLACLSSQLALIFRKHSTLKHIASQNMFEKTILYLSSSFSLYFVLVSWLSIREKKTHNNAKQTRLFSH